MIKNVIIIIQEIEPEQPGEEPKGESQLLWDPPLLTSASPESQNAQTKTEKSVSPDSQNAQLMSNGD